MTATASGSGIPIIQKEWVCVQHTGFARRKAEKWWREMGGKSPVPETVQEALDRWAAKELLPVTEILLKPAGRFYEVVGRKTEWQEGAVA